MIQCSIIPHCFSPKTSELQIIVIMETRAITKRDHTPQQLLVTKQINVTGMQNKRQTRAANCRKIRRLIPSYNHPRNFIAIASIVLEICT